MCRVLSVARAGFYAWLHHPISAREKDNQRLLTLIRDSYALSGRVYGYRRVHGDLCEIGETCGKNRVSRIMQLNRIKDVRGYKAPRRIAGRPSVVVPNRVKRAFTVVKHNQVWVTDITYIRTWQGWLYLAVVIELFARNVVGWSMKTTLSRELALDALIMAVWRRKPTKEVIVHSDSKLMLIEAGRLRLAEKAREGVTYLAQISDTKKPPFGGLIASLGAEGRTRTGTYFYG